MLKITRVAPALHTILQRFTGEAVTLRCFVSAPKHIQPQDIFVDACTNLVDKNNPGGNWVYQRMRFIENESKFASQSTSLNYLVFFVTMLPDKEGEFEFTSRAKINGGCDWHWAGNYQENAHIHILSPSLIESWANTIHCAEIVDGISVGNHMTACRALELGYDAVLNVTEEMDVHFEAAANEPQLSLSSSTDFSIGSEVIYKKIPIPDGQCFVIPSHSLDEAVNWLIANKGKRTIVSCRAGKFRSGSVAIAYVFKTRPNLTFEEALQLVQSKKCDIAPHRGLKESCYRLYRPTASPTLLQKHNRLGNMARTSHTVVTSTSISLKR